MGKRSTGSICTSETKRIELTYLLREGYLRQGVVSRMRLYWRSRNQPAGDIEIECAYTSQQKWLRLVYRLNGIPFDYKVQLVEINSNLGKGKVLYMICPATGEKCRILYLAYDSTEFISRAGYKRRVYYETQLCTKTDYWRTRFFQLKSRLHKLESSGRTFSYLGAPTKRIIRINRLKARKDICDINRWSEPGMTKSLIKAIKEANNRD